MNSLALNGSPTVIHNKLFFIMSFCMLSSTYKDSCIIYTQGIHERCVRRAYCVFVSTYTISALLMFVPTRIANMSCFNTLDFQPVDDLKLNPKSPAF